MEGRRENLNKELGGGEGEENQKPEGSHPIKTLPDLMPLCGPGRVHTVLHLVLRTAALSQVSDFQEKIRILGFK